MRTHPSWPRTKWELVFPEKCLHLISLPRIQWEPLHSSSSSSSSLHLSLFSSAWLLSGCISEATDALHRPWKGIQSNHLSSLTGNAKALWWMWSVPAWVHGRSPICSEVGDDVSGITMGGKAAAVLLPHLWFWWHTRKNLRAPRLRFIWNFSHFTATPTSMKRPRQQQPRLVCFKGIFLSCLYTFDY